MTIDEPRITGPILKVFRALWEARPAELSGAEIARSTGLRSGTLYPILVRFERAGWLASRWEAGDPQALGRPRRRFYQFTALGAAKASATFSEYTPAFGRHAWA